MFNDTHTSAYSGVISNQRESVKILKVCANKGKARIWIEGDILTAHGWNRGTPYLLATGNGIVRFLRADDVEHCKPRKVSGRTRAGASLPIIDCMAKAVQFLTIGASIEVSVTAGSIVIREVKV